MVVEQPKKQKKTAIFFGVTSFFTIAPVNTTVTIEKLVC